MREIKRSSRRKKLQAIQTAEKAKMDNKIILKVVRKSNQKNLENLLSKMKTIKK